MTDTPKAEDLDLGAKDTSGLTHGVRLAYTPGFLGLHFTIDGKPDSYPNDDTLGHKDMVYINALIEAYERLRAKPTDNARLEAQLRMVCHQRDEYAALLREARRDLRMPDLIARIEKSVDCSSVDPGDPLSPGTPE